MRSISAWRLIMENRIQKLFDKLPQGTQAALIKTDENRFYFLNFDAGDAGVMVLLPNKSYFIIDSRYIEIATNEVKHVEVVLEKEALVQVNEILKANNVETLLVESEISLGYAAKLEKALDGVKLDKTSLLSDAILSLRKIKDEYEIDCIRKAQSITDACFTHILPFIKAGVREVDIAIEMEMFMRKNGSHGIAFATILVAGKKTSLPHGEPGDNIVQNGDFVTLDFGAKVNGYCSDMTRTVAVGSVTEKQKHVYDTVLKAQLAACNGAKAGMLGCEVDKIARDIIYDAGYEGNFGHGLGHSLGIEIHEEPRYSPRSKEVVEKGTVMTIEPGVYLAGEFGVRIEDTVLVCENNIEIFAKSDKNLIIL